MFFEFGSDRTARLQTILRFFGLRTLLPTCQNGRSLGKWQAGKFAFFALTSAGECWRSTTNRFRTSERWPFGAPLSQMTEFDFQFPEMMFRPAREWRRAAAIGFLGCWICLFMFLATDRWGNIPPRSAAAKIIVIFFFGGIATAVLLFVWRSALRIDNSGVWRRRHIRWDLWPWEAFLEGKISDRPGTAFSLVYKEKPWYWRHLRLDFLAERERKFLLEVLAAFLHKHVPRGQLLVNAEHGLPRCMAEYERRRVEVERDAATIARVRRRIRWIIPVIVICAYSMAATNARWNPINWGWFTWLGFLLFCFLFALELLAHYGCLVSRHRELIGRQEELDAWFVDCGCGHSGSDN